MAPEAMHWSFAKALAAQKHLAPQRRHVEAKQERLQLAVLRAFLVGQRVEKASGSGGLAIQ
jgi:hypothetical protein